MDSVLAAAGVDGQRARIALLASEEVANTRIGELVDATVTTVLAWRERYQSAGLAGLIDALRSDTKPSWRLWES